MPLAVTAVATLFFIFVLLVMGQSIFDSIRQGVATEVVRMGDMSEQRSVRGMIVRHEQVVYAPRAGRVSFTVAEADRVRQRVRVARIDQDTDAGNRLANNVLSAENELIMLNARRHFAESDSNVQRINNNLQHVVSSNMHHFTALDIGELNNLHRRITQSTTTRNQVILDDGIGAVGEAGRHLETLRAQHQLNSTYIYATGSGIMYPVIDGHEGVVTPQNMRELSRNEVNFTVDHTAMIPTRDVQIGDPVFKLVDNTWYIVSYMPTAMTQGFQLNADRTVFVQNAQTGTYIPLLMRVIHIEHFATDTMVIFRSNRNVIDFLGQRNISIRTTDYVSRGLKVSNSAIVTRRLVGIPLTHIHGAEEFSVHLRTEIGLRQVDITVDEWRGDYGYVILDDSTGLIMGDELVSSFIGVDSFTINYAAVREEHGVYGVPFGYVIFIPISLEGELSEVDGYTLLDPRRNTGLREFSVIVTDASTVVPGEIIR